MAKRINNALLFLSLICLCIDTSRGWISSHSARILRLNLQSKTDVKPKTDKKTTSVPFPGTGQPVDEPSGIPGLFKETRDIVKEFNEYSESEPAMFYVVLFDDPINKRAYVAECLIEVFEWDNDMAESVMLQAHNFGYAVTGEWPKDTAESFCTALLSKGLHVEVHPVDKGED